jgi:hypothetical protein
VFSFHSTDGSSGSHKMVSENFQLISCIDLVYCIKCSPPFLSEFKVSACFVTISIADFPVISLRHSLVSGILCARNTKQHEIHTTKRAAHRMVHTAAAIRRIGRIDTCNTKVDNNDDVL